MPVSDRRQSIQKIGLLYNGISQQPPTARLPNQVADAVNANFSVIDGMTRRAGSWIQQHLADGLLPAGNNHLHAIVRDQDERYLVAHNRTAVTGAVIRVLELATNRWGTIVISADAQTYLNSASPSRFRFRTIVDYTLIVNSDVTLAAVTDDGVITANTVANPTVVTSALHGLVTGQTVTITDSNSSPTINGTHVVTVIDPNTFSIPVNVTVAGTAGTWATARITRTTMPVQMVRQNIGGDGAITVIAATNPAQVTSAGHGLITGQTVTITGSDSTPSIDGTHVVTVTSSSVFTVPVNVVVPGTTGTWESLAHFTIDVVAWNDRASGNDLTNPLLEIFTQGVKLSDLRYWRGRLWLLGNEWIVGSQAGDLFNLFIEDVVLFSDSDPIAVRLSSDELTSIDFGVPLRDSMILFTKAGVQFEFTSGDALTPSSVKAKPITRYKTLPAEPAVLDPNIYFATEVSCHVRLYEYVYDEIALPSSAEDVSAHVPELIPLQDVEVPAEIGPFPADESIVRTIDVGAEHGAVFLLRHDRVFGGEVFSRFVHVYRIHYLDGKKVQSAWTKWEFTGIRGIHDIAVIGDKLYMLVHCGEESPPDFFIVACSIPDECDDSDVPDDIDTFTTTTTTTTTEPPTTTP